MSTKTTFKRVALVAAAALTLGGISGVAAHATTLSAGYLNVFVPNGSSAVSYSQTATGWSITQVASANGTTTLAPQTDVDSGTNVTVPTPPVTTPPTTDSLSNLTTNFAGASSVSASPASVTLNIVSANLGLFGFLFGGVNAEQVTVTGTSLSASGTTVTAGVDSAKNTELTGADLLTGLDSTGVTGTALLSGGSVNTAFSPSVRSQLASIATTLNDNAAKVYVVAGSATDASIKIGTSTAGTVTGITYANFVNSANTGVIAAITPVETFNVTITAAQAAATLSSVKVSALPATPVAPATSSWADVTGKHTTFVAKSSESLNLDIAAKVYDSNSNLSTVTSNITLSPSLTYSVSGVGLLSTNSAVTGGSTSVGQTYIAVPAQTYVGQNDVYLISDGRSGTSTVTVSANGTTVGTITVTFYGKVASVTAVPLLSIAQAGGHTVGGLTTADTGASAADQTADAITSAEGFVFAGTLNNPAVAVVLKDSNGNIVPSYAGLSVASSNPSVVLSAIPSSFIDNGLGDGSVAFGYIHTTYQTAYGSTSGQKATLTYSVQNSDGSIVSSAPVSISLGGSVAKETISLDAASYTAGAPMTLTATAVDSAGNPVYDGAAGAALTANKSIVGLPSIKYSGGKFSSTANTLFAPATPGDFTIYGAGADAASTAYTVTATVGNDAADAASLATDAANAATDAANAAAESADNATQAASDALAAVQSLQSYVSKLFAGVKKEIAALLKLVHALKK